VDEPDPARRQRGHQIGKYRGRHALPPPHAMLASMADAFPSVYGPRGAAMAVPRQVTRPQGHYARAF
ncbi:MAG: hypothetical protein ACOY99_03530, partial [Pseudomonadota bacterium]